MGLNCPYLVFTVGILGRIALFWWQGLAMAYRLLSNLLYCLSWPSPGSVPQTLGLQACGIMIGYFNTYLFFHTLESETL